LNFAGFKPTEFARFGGLVDVDDPTALPTGVAAVCKNSRFHLTSVATRYGLQTAMQSKNAVAINGLAGLIFTAEGVGQVGFQRPMVFDAEGLLQVENPAGSGRLNPLSGALVSTPAGSQQITTQVYNRALSSYSNLKTPSSPISVYDLQSGNLDPYGQLPLGWSWTSGQAVIVGNYATPSIVAGNGHLYRCTTAGVTGANEPTWPVTAGAAVDDGTAVWTESTPVLVNRLPDPATAPVLTRVASGGAFPAGRDVWIAYSLTSERGETLTSPPVSLVNTHFDDGVSVPIPTLASMAAWVQGLPANYIPTGANIYEADVPSGTAQPDITTFELAASVALGSTTVITTTAASGTYPQTTSTARVTPGGVPQPNTPAVIRDSGAGTFPAGRDVYIILTGLNGAGETIPSLAGSLVNTVVNDAVQVDIPATTYQVTGINVYEADVPTGADAPPNEVFALVGTFQPNTTATITESATGVPPPTVNTAGTEGNIASDTVGAFRYAVFQFINRNGNQGGIVQGATIPIFVDVPGYELYGANFPVGPANIQYLNIGFTVADGTPAGPFFPIEAAAVSAGVNQTATQVANGTLTGMFDFTDTYLASLTSTDITDRFRVVQPPAAVDTYYSPTIDRVILTGVAGYDSGHYISLAADSESYYGDTSPIQVANGNGERCICAREFQGVVLSLKERSGYAITPGTTDPSSWAVQQLWTGEGPCGPRAIDVSSDFVVFVHRSGVYAYSGTGVPELISAEIQNFLKQVNWDYQHTIWVSIDVEEKEVRFGLPIGNATVPNLTLTMNYYEGTDAPIHFSSYVGKEVGLGECRKWSVDDIAGNLACRVQRQLPANASPFGNFRQSQVLIASSSPDGTVQAITPGVYNDNGAGIDHQYEGVCPQELMAIQMLGGVSLNAVGNGPMTVSVMVGRTFKVSPGQGRFGPYQETNEIKLPNFDLTPQIAKGYDAGGRGQNERFRMRFTNGKRPDCWFDLKYAALYTRPLFSGRTGSGN
jgi:hypothetical protein